MAKEINETIKNLADLMVAQDTENKGVIKDTFTEENVPADKISYQQFKDSFEYRDNLVAAQSLFTGRLAAKAIESKSDQEVFVTELKINNDTAEVTVHKSAQVPAGPKSEEGGTKTSHGTTRVSYATRATKNADLGRVKHETATLVAAAING